MASPRRIRDADGRREGTALTAHQAWPPDDKTNSTLFTPAPGSRNEPACSREAQLYSPLQR